MGPFISGITQILTWPPPVKETKSISVDVLVNIDEASVFNVLTEMALR